MNNVIWERESYRGMGPDKSSFFEKVRAAVWGSAQYLSPIVESISHNGTNFCRSVGWGNCWVSSGHPVSSVWMEFLVEREVKIWFPYQIFGLPWGGG